MARNNVVLYTQSPDGQVLPLEGTGATAQENRLPVDVGQTGFFEGREFRTFLEWATPTSGEVILKATVPVNVILHAYTVDLEEGAMRSAAVAGGTESGTFTALQGPFPANTMTEVPDPPSPQVVIETGGSLTGGTDTSVSRFKVAGTDNFSTSVDSLGGLVRGLGPATYYIRLTLTDMVGVLSLRWEERP